MHICVFAIWECMEGNYTKDYYVKLPRSQFLIFFLSVRLIQISNHDNLLENYVLWSIYCHKSLTLSNDADLCVYQ